MKKLKEVYDIKKQLVTTNIKELGDILKENSNIDTIDVNSDNTIYLESNCGIDSMQYNLNEGIKRWVPMANQKIMHNAILNILPLSNTSCIVKI